MDEYTWLDEPQTVPLGGLSLGGLSLSQPLSMPEPTAPSWEAASTVAPSTGSYSGGTGGGWGPSAYGYSGTTGLASNRGDAKYGLQSDFWDRLSAARRDMQAAGVGAFGITDGFRSYDAQVDVKRRKGDLAATPGRSVHGLGLAADLKLTPAQQRWLERNGARYGLGRLPSEKWHWQQIPTAKPLAAQAAPSVKPQQAQSNLRLMRL